MNAIRLVLVSCSNISRQSEFGFLRLAVLLTFACSCAESAQAEMPRTIHERSWSGFSRTATETHWTSLHRLTNSAGKVFVQTNFYAELGPGLNRRIGDSLVRANSSFLLTEDGAEATDTAHRLSLPGDIYSAQGVRVITPDGVAIAFAPLGIDYFDPTTGQSVLLDTIKNSGGWLVASNEVVYSNCFQHIKASVRVVNSLGGVECDLVFHEQPPPPEAYGLTEHARLEMMTEHLTGPDPGATHRVLLRDDDGSRGFVDPVLLDASLDFGGMQMITGRAFAVPERAGAMGHSYPAQMGKAYLRFDERRVLIEALPYRQAAPILSRLPLSQSMLTNAAVLRTNSAERASFVRELPLMHASTVPARLIRRVEPMMASVRRVQPAAILDYQLVSSAGITNHVFRRDTTYHVNGFTHAYGQTRIQGGTAVKFATGGALFFGSNDTVVCDTDVYSPAVFTSDEDATIGEYIAPMSGSGLLPHWYTYPFVFDRGTWELHDIRVRYLHAAIWSYGGKVTTRNLQALETVETFILDYVTALNVYNGLIARFGRLYFGNDVDVNLQNVTAVAGSTSFGFVYEPLYSSLSVTNSLLININGLTNSPSGLGAYSSAETTVSSSPSNVFTSAGGGGYYLPPSSTNRNSGTTNIDSSLLAALRSSTTDAPRWITNSAVLAPHAQVDTNTLDRGYHYPRIDYIVSDYAGALSVTGGVMVGWMAGSGGTNTVASIFSRGAPFSRDHFIMASQVQESATDEWVSALVSGGGCDVRFTDFSLRRFGTATPWKFFESDNYASGGPVSMRDSLVVGSGMWINSTNSGGLNVSFVNNIFSNTWVMVARAPYEWCDGCEYYDDYGMPQIYYGDLYGPVALGAFNNTLINSSLSFANTTDPFTSCSAAIHDNLIDGAVNVNDFTGVTFSHNAFTGTGPVSVDGNGNVMGLSLDFVSGPLGPLYYPTNGVNLSSLLDAGDRAANQVGLYHFTVRADQAKDATTTVDIGFHYPTLTAAGELIDSDQDGVPDILENPTGDGTVNAGETDWSIYNTLFGSGAGTGLDVFTPLKP